MTSDLMTNMVYCTHTHR